MWQGTTDPNVKNGLTYQGLIEGYLKSSTKIKEIFQNPEYIETLNHSRKSTVKIPPSRIVVGFMLAKELGFYDALMYQRLASRVRCLQILTRDVGIDLATQFIQLLYKAQIQLPAVKPQVTKSLVGAAMLDLSPSEYDAHVDFNMAYMDFCYVFPDRHYRTRTFEIMQNTTINCLEKIHGTGKVTKAMLLMVNNKDDCHFFDLEGILNMWDNINNQPFSWAINLIDRIPEDGGPRWKAI